MAGEERQGKAEDRDAMERKCKGMERKREDKRMKKEYCFLVLMPEKREKEGKGTRREDELKERKKG